MAHVGAVPFEFGRVSAMEPISRISAIMIITIDRHNIAASDSFRAVGIKDRFRTTMGIATTNTRVSVVARTPQGP